ncbi:MAG TPA: alkaline phosphatase family protein [Candidatus Tumulicola sp.]|nr:alkaline phosphatase family protein [Candidatus Tumulicola sp.]
MRVRAAISSSFLLIATLLAACAGPHAGNDAVPAGPQALASLRRNAGPAGVIKHVIIVIQENRTPDNLFQGLKGADIATSGLNSMGQTVPLHPVKLEAHYDPSHSHPSLVTEWDKGAMDGFDKDPYLGYCKTSYGTCAYGYVPKYENKPYVQMAEQYAFADRMFETNMGPSFPAHQYLISGTSTVTTNSKYKAADNPYTRTGHASGGGCESPPGALVLTIDPKGVEGNPVYPCFERPTLGDLLDAQHVSWRYYQYKSGQGLWHAYDAVKHIEQGPDIRNVLVPSDIVLNNIKNNALASVSWVTPSGADSDHSGTKSNGGPAWVSDIVNTVGASPYWNDCAIFILWDDPGGWYDHVSPQVFNSYELGFRIPLIVVSPYAKTGYVSHTQYEFGSVLKFVEETFSTGSLNTTDVRANSPDDMFNFAQRPRAFVKIDAPVWHPGDPNVPDSD